MNQEPSVAVLLLVGGKAYNWRFDGHNSVAGSLPDLWFRFRQVVCQWLADVRCRMKRLENMMRIALLGSTCLCQALWASTALGEVLFSMPFPEAEYPAGSDLDDHPDWHAQYDSSNDVGWPIVTGDIPELP